MIDFLLNLARDKKKMALAGIGLAVFLYVDFTFIIGAQVNGLKVLNKKISQLRSDIETLNKDIAYVRQNNQPVSAAQAVVKRLPQEQDISALLQHISGLAVVNGVRVMQIDSSKEAQKAVKVAKPSSKDKKSVKAPSIGLSGNLPVVKIKLDVIGSYHKIGSFINALENSEKFCFVDELMINRDPADPLKQRVNLVIKTYVKK